MPYYAVCGEETSTSILYGTRARYPCSTVGKLVLYWLRQYCCRVVNEVHYFSHHENPTLTLAHDVISWSTPDSLQQSHRTGTNAVGGNVLAEKARSPGNICPRP